MKRAMAVLAVACVALVAVASCSKKGGGRDEMTKMPEEYSAGFTMSTPAGAMKGKIYAEKDKVRMELPQSTVITRMDKGVSWILMPAGMYMEQPVSIENTAGMIDSDDAKIERTLVAEETINGVEAKKYKVSFTKGDMSGVVYQWIDEKNDIPVKVLGEDGSWFIEYRDVKPGKQEASLFELPEGLTKMEMPAMPGK